VVFCGHGELANFTISEENFMQIDFHHAVTYVVARLAGFNTRKAGIVAYCSQYVDDATNAGQIKFDTGAMYQRISSAHKMLDYRNFKELANHQVWIPFHFLPSNGGMEAGKNPRGTFINKIVCRPNSPIAQDMVRDCIVDQDRAFALHRLGITMHVFADTWAHQGFAGVNHKINDTKSIKNFGRPNKAFKDRIVSFFVGESLPLGHGTVLSYPDRPYLKWSYIDWKGKSVQRNNPKDFLEAVEHMHEAMVRFINKDPDMVVPDLPVKDKNKIKSLISSIKDEDGEERHKKWLKAIERGDFSFGPEKLTYIPKGAGSWKHKSIGTREWVDSKEDVFIYKDTFLKSNWKLFHDALQAHRFRVVHDILPKYGISAA
jgi:hypothetical protein